MSNFSLEEAEKNITEGLNKINEVAQMYRDANIDNPRTDERFANQNAISHHIRLFVKIIKYFRMNFSDNSEESLDFAKYAMTQLPKIKEFDISLIIGLLDPSDLIFGIYIGYISNDSDEIYKYLCTAMKANPSTFNDEIADFICDNAKEWQDNAPGTIPEKELQTIVSYAFWFLFYQHIHNIDHPGLVELTTNFLTYKSEYNDRYYEAFIKILSDMGYNAILPPGLIETALKPPDTPINNNCGYVTYAISPHQQFFNDVLGSIAEGKNYKALASLKGKYSHQETIQVKRNEEKKATIFQRTKGNNSTTVIIPDIDKISHNSHQRKITRYIMINANCQCYSNGERIRNDLHFPISDIIGDNLYKNADTARRGFRKACELMRVAAVEAIEERIIGGKKKIVSQPVTSFILGYDVKENVCIVLLNPIVDYNLIFKFYTILPSYFLNLPDRSSDLLEYIFTQARQNGAKLKEGQSFNLSFRSICYKLNIPTEEEVSSSTSKKRDYNRFIKKPLVDAISELIAMNDNGYTITVHCDNKLPIAQYLDTGYIEISVNGDSPYFKPLTEMSRRKEQIIQQREEKEERIAIGVQAAIEEKKQKTKSKQDT